MILKERRRRASARLKEDNAAERNAEEASAVTGLDVYPVVSLRTVVAILNRIAQPEPFEFHTYTLPEKGK